jgi:hypothetical protein
MCRAVFATTKRRTIEMTRAKPNTRNSELKTQVLKGELFRLASIELLAASSSEGKRFAFAQRRKNAERLCFQFPSRDLNLFKKRLTAALTWRETATDKLRVKRQRDKKVAVSRSRPITC